jgi:hypothetical protein
MASVPTNMLRPDVALVGAPPDNIILELTSGVIRVVRRAEIYESDGVTPFAIDNWNARLVTGNVTVDRDRDERRAIDILLENSDGALKMNPLDGFWYDKVIKTFWGIRYYDSVAMEWRVWETPLGEFMIDRIDEDRFPNAVKVTGRDFTKKCLISKLAYSLSFQSGLPVESIIKALAANCGITKFALPVTGQNYTSDLVFTRGTERWKVMQELASTVGYEVYFRADGCLSMRLLPDPTTQPVSWSFNYGGGGSLVDYSRSSDDSRIYNHIMVTGAKVGGDMSAVPGEIPTDDENQTAEIVFAEVINTDPGSPTNVARIGDRVLPYESDLFTTQASAMEYALTMLRIAALEEYTMSFKSLMLPWLEPTDIVEIIEDEVSASEFVPSRFLLTNLSIPLGLGAMSGNARRVTIVGNRNTLDFQ